MEAEFSTIVSNPLQKCQKSKLKKEKAESKKAERAFWGNKAQEQNPE